MIEKKQMELLALIAVLRRKLRLSKSTGNLAHIVKISTFTMSPTFFRHLKYAKAMH